VLFVILNSLRENPHDFPLKNFQFLYETLSMSDILLLTADDRDTVFKMKCWLLEDD